MCTFIANCAAIICIVISHTQRATTAVKNNCTDYELFQDFAEWNFGAESARPVRNVGQSLQLVENEKKLEIELNGVEGNIKMGLLAIPYLNDPSKCPINITENQDLRRHECVLNLSGPYSSVSASFRDIFSGCYYVAIRNDREENWLVGPTFHNTSYRYLDSKLKADTTRINPESETATKELKTLLRVPLSCLGVRARLYEFSKPVNATVKVRQNEMIDERLFATQDCRISNVEKNGRYWECDVSNLTTSLGVEVNAATNSSDGWSAVINWKNLLRGGKWYYLRFGPMPADCRTFVDFETWDLIGDKDIFHNLGYVNASNTPKHEELDSVNWIPIVFTVVGIVVIATVAYFIFKFLRLINTSNRGIDQSQKSRDNIVLCEKESEHILLLYVKGCRLFMRTIEIFRNRLKQNCHCHIHDLYAMSEWNTIAELGAVGWIEKLLRDGSKVVWVDTPQFRSRLNDRENHLTGGDFRDNAIPYAVALATDLFQNATTQYRRHFVVRMEGFEVDDRQDDPLLLVSPHARYHIPEHLAILCEHLRGPLKNLEDRSNDE